MKAGKYSIRDLFLNRYISQIVVPEIQRDYVWQREQVTGLFQSIVTSFHNFKNAPTPIQLEDKDLEQALKELYQKRKFSSNIGFIYAYNDPELDGSYFLIDGQQRITTIFLILLNLAKRSSSLRELFHKTYLIDGNKTRLDYKVREASHTFLAKFSKFCLEGRKEVELESWLFDWYKNDITIQNLLNNANIINELLDKENTNEVALYDFLENLVEFWYFDTNVSEQGEELYIYMNARGEQMQANENLKAEFLGRFSSPEEKNQWGKEWENWQDYFWRHKGENENADKGFNEFLFCIAGLENYLNDKDPTEFSDQKIAKSKLVLDSGLSLEKIKEYIEALQQIEAQSKLFKDYYQPNFYTAWVDLCIGNFWSIINSDTTDWFANYNDDNQATERRRMVFIWSILRYFENLENNKYGPLEHFRAVRAIFLKFYNNIRSVSKIKNWVFQRESNFYISHSSADEDNEEILKFQLLSGMVNNTDRFQIESLIWEIEDHEYNLKGDGVGGTNISHLIDLKGLVTVQHLTLVRDKFAQLFNSDVSMKVLQSVLLFFGDYWYKASPKYYDNMAFGLWPRNVRNNAFKLFFTDFLAAGKPIEEFLNDLRSSVEISIDDASDMISKLIWYNVKLKEDMWSKGNYLAIRHWLESDDKVFTSIKPIFNTGGTFNGYNQVELFEMLPESEKLNVLAYHQKSEEYRII